MAIGDPVSKDTTYGEIEDKVALATGVVGNSLFPPAWFLKEISLSVQKLAGVLNNAQDPFYTVTNTSLTLSGSANPYSVDLSSLSPFIDRIIRFVHITSGGTRTQVKFVSEHEAEERTKMSNIFATSLWGSWEGDAIRVYAGSSFTITPASDTTELKYYRQPKVTSVTRNSKVDIKDTIVPAVIEDMIAKVERMKPNANI